MNEYQVNKIRNVAIVGHMGSGKTSFCEAALYLSHAIKAKGTVEGKNTVSDYTAEEQARQTSLISSLIPVEYNGYKVNMIDVPGSEELRSELTSALSVVKGAVLVVDAQKGVESGTVRCWKELRSRHMPTVIFVNKLDAQNVKYEKVINEIKEKFGKDVIPFCYPVGEAETFKGLEILPDKKLCLYTDGTCAETNLEDMSHCGDLYEALKEAAAMGNDALMEKYFGGEELTADEIREGIRVNTINGDLCPLICGSSTKNIGIDKVVSLIIDTMPAPNDCDEKKAKSFDEQSEVSVKTVDEAPFTAYVFKTIVDPFVGTINFFKIYSGSLKPGQDIYVPNTEASFKMPQIFTLMGKTQIQLECAHAGDIVAAAKLPDIEIGYTLCDKKANVKFDKAKYRGAIFFYAITPKNKQDEDKISTALQKISLEDPNFEYRRNPETSQLLIGGQGVLHLSYIIDKLKNIYKVEVETADPKIVYRETIRSKTTGEKGVQGRHKKQSGGAGQFGDVWIKFEPIDKNNPEEADKDFIFKEEVFGGSVPKNYFPAVEKGLIQAMEKGPLAGFPVVGVKATLVDGSYHPVDSNEVSFVLAAKLAWQAAIKEVKPVILEPIMELHITVDNQYVGDIMSDMSKRRGRITGQDDQGDGKTKIIAIVPEAEIIKYQVDLKTMTQAGGSYTRYFYKYDICPEDKMAKIIEEYKQD